MPVTPKHIDQVQSVRLETMQLVARLLEQDIAAGIITTADQCVKAVRGAAEMYETMNKVGSKQGEKSQ
jgi:hypothetical protein